MPIALRNKLVEAQQLANRRNCPVVVYRSTLLNAFYGCAFTLPRFGERIETIYPIR
jgi:hypothetical protein